MGEERKNGMEEERTEWGKKERTEEWKNGGMEERKEERRKPYQKLLRLKGEVSQSDGGVSHAQKHTLRRMVPWVENP